jgi:hypothetical protein
MLTRAPEREQFIGTIDAWQLHQMRWPILRFLARRFVEQRELEHYVEQLLTTGKWQAVRIAPAGAPHMFEVYGTPAAGAFRN